VQSVASVEERPVEKENYQWDNDYVARWINVVNPVMDMAQEEGWNVVAVTK